MTTLWEGTSLTPLSRKAYSMNLLTSLPNLLIAPGDFFTAFRTEAEDPEQAGTTRLFGPPLAVLVLLGLVSMFFLQDLVKDVQFEQAVSRIENNSRLTEEKKEELMLDMKDRFEHPSTALKVLTWGSSAVSLPIRSAVMALMALLIGNFIFGGNVRYGVLFGMTAWAYLINVIELIVKVPLMLKQWTVEVYTGLGLLGIGEPGSFLGSFLGQIDLFSLWRIVLISIGMGILYRQTTTKYLVALLVLWLLQITVTSGLVAAFS
ncbi:MAG: hypothetical protein D6762_01330 [Candidatus Neomarinimicrobiota bacterium]|nr:MAG: hypothetical protein D6762_01330 [Candidatus Neomarinimicrobiota bacterium]